MTTNINFSKVRQDFYPLGGGLDLVTPAIELSPGKLIYCQNYEPAIGGGYRRLDGYERFDGQSSPTAASYYLVYANITGTVAVGNTITGLTSGATGVVLGIFPTYLVCGRATGTFQVSESIQVSAVTVGAITALTATNGASMPSDHADYLLLAANDQRQFILTVPGSGKIRGVWVYADTVYAFRDNVGATAGQMWKATTGGWVQVTFGKEIGITTMTSPSATITVTIASPAVISWASHPFVNGQPIQLTTTGALPTGLSSGVTYYVINQSAGTFQLAQTVGGAAIVTSGTQSGVHTGLAWGNTVTAGSTITGKTSGAIATVNAALLRTGSWTVQTVGTLVITVTSGTFVSGEALTVGGLFVTQTSSVANAITRLPGGSMEFFNYNFTGSTNTTKMYGVDGVNAAFEFDGTNYVPIHTGMATDTPTHVIAHKSFLFLSFLGSVQFSGLGAPYSWSIVLGAGEFDCSKPVSGFLPQGGNYQGSSLAIFTAERTFVLYGTSAADFKLVSSIFDIGYSPFTCQQVSNDAYGWTARGIQTLITTLNYGDFDYSSISHMVQPLVTKKRGLECASTAIKTKNQYRVFFTDGTALAVGLTGDKVSALTVLNYNKPVRCICTSTLSTGQEVTYFGSDDGYVYQDAIGTSQDGNTLEAWCGLPFNSIKSPQVRKRFRRAVFETVIDGFAKVNFSYDLGYGNPNVQPSDPIADSTLIGGGGYWDQTTWDQCTWDAQLVTSPSFSLTGTEKTISFLLYSNYAQCQSHTLQGVTLVYNSGRLER